MCVEERRWLDGCEEEKKGCWRGVKGESKALEGRELIGNEVLALWEEKNQREWVVRLG